jgi:uncharacterized protein YwgA
MRRTDWLLLFVAAVPERAVDPIRIQKGLFLLAMSGALPDGERYAFEPYAYGPMSRELYRDTRALRDAGLLEARPVPGRDWDAIQITADGIARANELSRAAATAGAAEVAAIRAALDDLSFEQLLAAVYERHPEYAVRSVFRPS